MATPTVTFSSLDRPIEPITEKKASSSWWRSNGEYPGKYEDRDRESKDITGTQEFFDGMRFDCQRGLSNNFYVAHIFSLGSSESNGTYIFNTNYATSKVGAFGRYDGEGRVTGKLSYSPNSKFIGSVTSTVGLEPAASSVSVELDYKGDDSHTQLKTEGRGIVILNYMQGIYNSFAAGAEVLHVPSQGTILSGCIRHAWPPRKSPDEPHKNIFALTLSSMFTLNANYTYRTAKKAEFATEYQGGLGPDGSYNDIWSAGFAYSFRSSRVKARVDSQGRVGAVLDEHISPYMRISLVGDLDHKEQKYKLGLGFSLLM